MVPFLELLKEDFQSTNVLGGAKSWSPEALIMLSLTAKFTKNSLNTKYVF
jgi:hypothetical protein